MQVTQETVDYGLLSELAYLRLESDKFKNDYIDYGINKNIKDFITDNNEETTGIDPTRKQQMKDILNKYTILDFKDTNAEGGTGSGMQAMFVRENSTGKTVLLFRGTEFDTAFYDDVFKADGYMALGGSTQQM